MISLEEQSEPTSLGCGSANGGLTRSWNHPAAPNPFRWERAKIQPDRLLAWHDLAKIIPYCRVHIGRLEHQGKFPKRLQIGPGRVAWRLSEVEAWLQSRPRGALPSGAGSAATLAAREGGE
jgi:predicted DNA-binding transcriptional regulator AlpA